MSNSSLWILLAAAGLGTFLLRLSFLAVVRGEVPPLLQRILRLVPAAVLAALVAPAVMPDAATPAGWFKPAAAAIAALVAVRSGNMLATLAAGMAVLWLLSAAI